MAHLHTSFLHANNRIIRVDVRSRDLYEIDVHSEFFRREARTTRPRRETFRSALLLSSGTSGQVTVTRRRFLRGDEPSHSPTRGKTGARSRAGNDIACVPLLIPLGMVLAEAASSGTVVGHYAAAGSTLPPTLPRAFSSLARYPRSRRARSLTTR